VQEEATQEKGITKYIPQDDYAKNKWRPFGPRKEHFCKACKYYYKNLYDKNITIDKFMPICYGDTRLLFPPKEELGLETDEEYLLAKTVHDPLSWAEVYFNWKPRWYQEEIICCSSARKVIRAGRRLGKTAGLTIAGLHYAATHKNCVVLVIAPFQSQVARYFEEALKIIDENEDFKNSIRIRMSPPMQLSFNNGSVIRGFASGANSGGKQANQIRGQDAHVIILDEMDFQNDYDMEVILAIIASHPEVQIMASSTPKGWRKKFWQLVNNKNLRFKEFHYISHESPSWTDEAEELLIALHGELGFMHEYLAEFGEEAFGVFRSDLVDACLVDYNLRDEKPVPGTQYIMGVDWNTHAGVHIVILGWTGTHYRLAKKVVIRKQEFTQLAAVKKIIDLDIDWNCKGIYVDHGDGSVQIELLKETGVKFPETKLHKKVVGVKMGGKVIMNDPYTGREVKKGTKQFIVELCQRQVEDGRIIFPKEEDTEVIIEPDVVDQPSMGVVQQMRGFVVARVSQSGQPIYSQGYEHTLTAWMLAIYGFMEEYGALSFKNFTTKVAMYEGEFGNSKTKQRDPNKGKEGTRRVAVPRGIDVSPRLGRTSYSSVTRNVSDRAKILREIKRGGRVPFRRDPRRRSM